MKVIPVNGRFKTDTWRITFSTSVTFSWFSSWHPSASTQTTVFGTLWSVSRIDFLFSKEISRWLVVLSLYRSPFGISLLTRLISGFKLIWLLLHLYSQFLKCSSSGFDLVDVLLLNQFMIFFTTINCIFFIKPNVLPSNHQAPSANPHLFAFQSKVLSD